MSDERYHVRLSGPLHAELDRIAADHHRKLTQEMLVAVETMLDRYDLEKLCAADPPPSGTGKQVRVAFPVALLQRVVSTALVMGWSPQQLVNRLVDLYVAQQRRKDQKRCQTEKTA